MKSAARRLAPSLVLAASSGAAALMQQLLWIRRMVDVLGANAGTFSRVIAAFFLGLALGAWLASRRTTPRPWRSVACAEWGIAALAFLVLGFGVWAQSALPDLLRTRLFTWLLPLALIAPPAIAMGLVVPWMIRAVGSAHAVAIYGANTLGGLAGLALVSGWMLPAFGLAGASLIAISCNVIVAFGAWAMAACIPSDEAESVIAGGRPVTSMSAADAVTAFTSGFLVLGAEVIFQHQFAQLLISSHLSSALVLALVLSALVLATLLVPVIARFGSGALLLGLGAAALACAAEPVVFIVQRGGLYYVPFAKPLPAYLLDALRIGLPACTLVLLPAGLVFPLLLRKTTAAGIDAGGLFAINGLGGWCGAELGERLIAPIFGLWWSMAILASGYALCVAVQPGRWRWPLVVVLAGAIAWSWKLDARLPYAGLTPGDTLVKVTVGREGVVGVVRGEPDDWRILFNNTYTLGGSRAQIHQERQTLLPMLLHGEARRVATLGVATGSSLAGATLDSNLEQAEGIELSPLVLGFAREYFAGYNRHVADDPRVKLTIDDARIAMLQRPGAFDVIEGDLFLPWRTGEARLFAREHFTRVRRALRPGGLFCQWLPMYQLTQSQFETIVRTFREVFPDAWLVRGDFYVSMPILGLVGGRSLESIDWQKVEIACNRVRDAGGCRDPLLRHAEGVAMCVIGPAPAPPPGTVNTLANSWLEWDAARNVIGQREPWFAGVPYANYLRSIHQTTTPRLPENLRAAHADGLWFHALEIAGAARLPQAETLGAQARDHLPASLRDDRDASWKEWPMRHRPPLP